MSTNTQSNAEAGSAAPEITVAEYLESFAGQPVQVVDVREPNEWAIGHIPGSLHIPMDDLSYRWRELDPNQPVVTVCRSGKRSLVSADALLTAGFRDVHSLTGGIIAWAEAGQPIEY